MKGKKILAKLLCAVVAGNMAVGMLPGTSLTVRAAEVQVGNVAAGSAKAVTVKQTTEELEKKKYNDVPAYQYKDLYTTARMTVKGLPVEEVVNATMNPIYTTPIKKAIKFVIYNTTKQETDQIVTAENRKLYNIKKITSTEVDGSETPAQPSADLKTLNVKVVDQKGIPVSGIRLHISSLYCCDNQFKNVTDANGKASYTLTQHEGINLPFTVTPVEGTDYEVVTALDEIYFTRDTEKNENYISKVNGKAFNGEEVTLVVKKEEFSVTEVAGPGTEVKRAGDTAVITVKGTKLPTTFYYVLYCYAANGLYVGRVKEREVQATGTETERIFVAEFPSVLDFPAADHWVVGVEIVSEPEDGYYVTRDDKVVKIEKDTVTEESKTAMAEALAEAEKKKSSDYTEDSWRAYQEAVEAAKALAEKEDATNIEYQKAIQAVKDAEDALQKAEIPEPTPNPEPTVEKKIGSVKLAKTSFTYNGKEQKPGVVAKDNKGKKIAKSFYTVKYDSGCKKVGKYTIKITFKGGYKGTYTKTFKILPKRTSFKSVKAGKKSFTATWKKQSKQTSGYQVQYAKDKKFTKSVRTTTISKNTTVKKTVKRLSAKKTYYVRVRTYKTVKASKKSVKIYSGWSAAKKIKTK